MLQTILYFVACAGAHALSTSECAALVDIDRASDKPISLSCKGSVKAGAVQCTVSTVYMDLHLRVVNHSLINSDEVQA
jgi:hypothetical protein